MGTENVQQAQATGLTGAQLGASAPRSNARKRLTSIRDAVGAVIGVFLGLLPHVLHHIGLIAGVGLVAGARGNTLFFVVGLLFSLPMLRRLYRRFRTWRAPAIAIGVFAALFSLSAFVISPALSGGSTAENGTPARAPTQSHSDHHPE